MYLKLQGKGLVPFKPEAVEFKGREVLKKQNLKITKLMMLLDYSANHNNPNKSRNRFKRN